MKDRLNESIVKPTLQKPSERQSRHEIGMPSDDVNDLMRDGRPEDRQSTSVNLHLASAGQIRDRAALQKIEFNFVVTIGPPHERGRPSLAGEPVWGKVGAPGVESHENLR